MKFKLTLPTAAFILAPSAFSQTKWDLPAAYAASKIAELIGAQPVTV